MSEPQILHAVYAEGGEYESAYYDLVALYADRSVAEEHARLAAEFQAQLQKLFVEDYDYSVLKANPFDPYMEAGNTWRLHTRYIVVVEFVHERPAHFARERAVLEDAARANGWLP